MNLRAGDILVLVNGEYVVVEWVQHEILESPVNVYNFQVEDYHTYYVSDAGVLVHNECNVTQNVASRQEALAEGKEFLGPNYKKVGNGMYRSADGYRQMRFDFTHHNGTIGHINLETFKYSMNEVRKMGVKNKIVRDVHIFWPR